MYLVVLVKNNMPKCGLGFLFKGRKLFGSVFSITIDIRTVSHDATVFVMLEMHE